MDDKNKKKQMEEGKTFIPPSNVAKEAQKANLTSVLLHEVVTDMGLALNFDWLFKSYFSYLTKKYEIMMLMIQEPE